MNIGTLPSKQAVVLQTSTGRSAAQSYIEQMLRDGYRLDKMSVRSVDKEGHAVGSQDVFTLLFIDIKAGL